LPDGGWSFDHRGGKCNSRCRNHGSLEKARIAATSLAMLTFLGWGQTHKEGHHKAVMQDGLTFLLSKMKGQGNQTADFTEPGGTMYSQGLAALVLCEAYAMSHDKELRRPAQLALNYIVAAQDPVGGGWRYVAKQPGDTSVLGWQLMALKSGRLAKLDVPSATIQRACKFLDSVATEEGSQYGYTTPVKGRGATTAIGLLARRYTGWKPDHPAMVAGVKFLSDQGPSKTNLYYDFFAGQVLHLHEGDPWDSWNRESRKRFLADDQGLNAKGHEEGSWFIEGDDPGAKAGGRLYCTAMAVMSTHVYYRHISIYTGAAYQDTFGLDGEK